MIKFEVNRQIVKITHCDTVVADSIDYIEAEVVFSSEDWQSMDRTYLHFCDGENDYPIDVTDGKIEKSNHLCLTAGRWDVWAHGNRFDNGTVAERITTNVIGIKVKPSGAIEGQIMPMPASIAEQLDARVTYLEEHGGGGGGTDNYNNLQNLPKINGTTLSGDKSASELGLASAEDLNGKADKIKVFEDLSKKVDRAEGKGLSSNDYTNEDKQKLADLQNYDDTAIREHIKDSVIHVSFEEKTLISELIEKDYISKIENKVDKISGKGLSSNDYTNEDKTKLDSLHNYDDTDLQAEIEQKSDKTTIIASSDTTATVELLNNSEYRYINALSNFTITFPAEIPNDYITSVMFYSIGVPTNLTYPSGIKWSGDDIVSGEFVPASGKKYTLCLWYDGVYNGIVRGVANA